MKQEMIWLSSLFWIRMWKDWKIHPLCGPIWETLNKQRLLLLLLILHNQ